MFKLNDAASFPRRKGLSIKDFTDTSSIYSGAKHIMDTVLSRPLTSVSCERVKSSPLFPKRALFPLLLFDEKVPTHS